MLQTMRKDTRPLLPVGSNGYVVPFTKLESLRIVLLVVNGKWIFVQVSFFVVRRIDFAAAGQRRRGGAANPMAREHRPLRTRRRWRSNEAAARVLTKEGCLARPYATCRRAPRCRSFQVVNARES
ncbi:MAG: hypothetical protein KatS3mg111_3175 [Pirellulaceae bacterium]|nr:MAG: hypothetical protein KatS3mg111_3175 [Pirellulaceae bacterium]